MNDFNKESEIAKMQVPAKKLIAYFKTKGFDFISDDGENNIMFLNEEKEIKISHHSFYRFSGIAVYTKDSGKDDNRSVTVVVTDDMFMNDFMKPIVQTMLNAQSAIKPTRTS